MEIRQITPDYAVGPQITPADLSAIAAAGYRTVICNRPDDEVAPGQQMGAMRAAARAAGLTFVENPVVNGALRPKNITVQRDTIAGGAAPVFAYCRSGTRSSAVWALAQAGAADTETILAATARAGYRLDGLRPQLDALAARQNGRVR